MKRTAIIAALFLLGVAGQVVLAVRRPLDAPLADEGVAAALGGLRSIVAEAVWLRADALQQEGRYVELAQLASTLAHLEPHTPEVWSFAAWNLAYNVSLMMPTLEDRWRWVLAAMRLLRDGGLRLNPGSAEICRELAWMFEVKIGAEIDEAAPVYRERWREIVRDVAVRGAWAEIGMDEREMAEAEREYGITDWGLPQSSAIYWARRGLRTATGNDREFLMRIIAHSARIVETGEVHRPRPIGQTGGGR